MKPLLTERLILRNWEERDRDLCHLINSDEQVMEFYPFRRTRGESDAQFATWRDDIDRLGFGMFALELRDGGECIGYCGIKHANVMPHLPEETVEIGWRLAPPFWGRGYVTEAARRSLDFGFDDAGLSEIIAYAVPANRRSTAVMERLGMRRDEPSDFDHPRVPDSKPHLKRHVVYRLSADDWRQKKKAG
jgi:RimJ/RimL family protein N-acetyltransferase